MKPIILVFITALFFSGCSVLGIGDVSQSPCDGECDFKEAGVCTDAITIYTHRHQLVNRKVRDNWFSEDEDPYIEKYERDASFTRLNEEQLGE